jgi:hypothetical protein
VSTGKYALLGNTFIVNKQLYDADGDEMGSAEPIALFGIPYLQTGSVSDEQSQLYTLKREDIDAGNVRFFYRWEVEDSHLFKDDGNIADLKEDYVQVFVDEYYLRTVIKSTPTTTATTRPTATPTPRPNPVVGISSAVKITRTGNNRIFFDLRARGQDFSMPIGFLAPDGTRGFQRNGYIRDESLGQTYAVVNRESDDKVVRVWIAPDSPERYKVPWDEVIEFYTFRPNIVNAIPLDETHPAEKQIVKVGIDWYVYLANAWRHIPDIPTFQARGYYWCDVTSADIGFLSRVRTGRALQSSGTDEVAGYPSCRE